jgi:hypothetical protein
VSERIIEVRLKIEGGNLTMIGVAMSEEGQEGSHDKFYKMFNKF